MSEDEKREVVTVDEIEALLERLPGVTSARVVVNDWGAIEEIHILGTSERNPKQVVRDVESSMAARWGISIDHKKVSVAQLTGNKASLAQPMRLKILSVGLAVDSAKGHVEASVTLGKNGDDEFRSEGTARALTSPSQSRRALSQATLSAVNRLLESGYSFLLEEVGAIDLGPREVVVVTMVLLTPRGNEELLVGAVVNKGDINGAVVKATLDALNRRLGKLVAFGKREMKPDSAHEPGATDAK
jgi:hypothetical protein